MSTTKTFRKFRWFFAWDDEKEEAWLRDMSNQGFHMMKVIFPGIYTFEEGEKKDYAYRLDYSPSIRRMDDYLNIFRDAGWTYLGCMNYWQYFRKEVTGEEAPQIFTDSESKTVKYKRLIALFSAILPLTVINIVNLSNMSFRPVAIWLTVLMVLCLFLLLFGIAKMLKRINDLKKL